MAVLLISVSHLLCFCPTWFQYIRQEVGISPKSTHHVLWHGTQTLLNRGLFSWPMTSQIRSMLFLDFGKWHIFFKKWADNGVAQKTRDRQEAEKALWGWGEGWRRAMYAWGVWRGLGYSIDSSGCPVIGSARRLNW
jgi:hypothetical protein